MRAIANHLVYSVSLFFWSMANAQSFKYKASLEPAPISGFYAIPITPQLSSFVKPDFSDFRIVDEKGNFIPYIVKSSLPVITAADFVPLRICSNRQLDSGKNVIILEKNNYQQFSGFYLKIKNASVSRITSLSGSDDSIHWYAIIDNLSLQKKFVTDDDNYMDNIDFPLSSYRFFKLTIYNGKSDPLNIISVGTYSRSAIRTLPPFVENPAVTISQKDSSDKCTYITVQNPSLYHISHIMLVLKGPKFFRRNMDIIEREFNNSLTICSDSLFQFDVPVFDDSIWRIRIHNGDNPPLLVHSVTTGQEQKKLIAYLESGIQYGIEMTSETAALPQYELQEFKDSISINAPALRLSAVEPLTTKAFVSPTLFKQWWIWPVIISTILVLTIFTFRLSKEVSKKPDEV
jgi:hypothetical protein